jgi:hypothetical protein
MMMCPRCRSEYRDGFTTCADCGGDLVVANPDAPEASPAPAHVDGALVPVFESGDPSLILLAKSALESAGIEFWTRGEGNDDPFGLGMFPARMSMITGPVIFEVRQADATTAAGLLADLGTAAETGELASSGPESADPEATDPAEGD